MQSRLTRGRVLPQFCEARCGARGCSLGSQSEHGVQPRGPVPGRPGPRPAQKRREPIGIALIDRDERICQVLAQVIKASQEFALRGCFATAAEAIHTLPGLDVEVVVTEMALPDLCGLRCARQLLAMCPELAVIIASAIRHPLLIRSAFAVGASQYLVKPVQPGQFLATLRFVSCRRRVPAVEARTLSFLQATLGRRSATACQQAGGADPHPPGFRATMHGSGVVDVPSEHPLQASLTAQEVEMLQHLAKGLVWKEIEERLQVSHCTLRSMKRWLFLKLGHARNRTEALAQWFETQHIPNQPEPS